MNLREYQAKKIFSEYGIPVPPGRIANNSTKVKQVADELNCPVVLKPQLGIKKRGKLGIIAFAENAATAEVEAGKLFNKTIKNVTIKKILVESKVDIKEELYVAVTIDYSQQCPVIILSLSGGVDIEDLAKNNPESILKLPINILFGLTKNDKNQIKKFIGIEIANIVEILYTIFRKYDAELIEINPLVRTNENKLIAVDGVLNINDSSLFRHPELLELKQQIGDFDTVSEKANENKWTYIDLPGNIGILSSGAGLTMAILDLLQYAGGSAANFLDTAQIDEEGIYKAFELLESAKPTKAVLINIFAGLNRCDKLAEGIIKYLKENPIEKPIVVRMIGNKEEVGHQMLKDYGIEPYTELEETIKRVVELAQK